MRAAVTGWRDPMGARCDATDSGLLPLLLVLLAGAVLLAGLDGASPRCMMQCPSGRRAVDGTPDLTPSLVDVALAKSSWVGIRP